MYPPKHPKYGAILSNILLDRIRLLFDTNFFLYKRGGIAILKGGCGRAELVIMTGGGEGGRGGLLGVFFELFLQQNTHFTTI